MEDFFKPKIAWPSVGATEYSLIPEGFFLLDTNYFLTSCDLISLLAFLNSNLIEWWINSEDTQLGDGGAWRHYKYNLEKLCIPQDYRVFDSYINKILISKDYVNKECVAAINFQIYKAYKLNEHEIEFILSQQN